MVAPEMIRTNKVNLDLLLQAVAKWKMPESVKSDLRFFVRELGMGKINRGRRLKDSAQAKYLLTLKVPLEFLNKKTEELKIADVENFEMALGADSLTSTHTQKPYQHATKISFRKALRVFLRWKLGEAESQKLAGWLDIRRKDKTPDFISEEDIKKLFSYCRTPEQRYVVAVLFDSGARAQEFVNIRFEDIQLPTEDQKFPKIHLRQEYSKTLGRNIALYWKNSADAIIIYVKQRLAEGMKAQDPVFNNTYGSIRMFLKRLGKRSLKRHVHAHLFRHSSATFYAAKLNRQELCYRYGWRFSSAMPDVYISRAGLENKELDMKFEKSKIAELESQYEDMEVQFKMKTDRLLEMEKKMNLIIDHFGTLANLHQQGIKSSEVESLLKTKI